jgi:hypothetical protein
MGECREMEGHYLLCHRSHRSDGHLEAAFFSDGYDRDLGQRVPMAVFTSYDGESQRRLIAQYTEPLI